jgi:hypothetical protein
MGEGLANHEESFRWGEPTQPPGDCQSRRCFLNPAGHDSLCHTKQQATIDTS